MNEKSKKLKLTRETVRLLSAASARKVAGGSEELPCESDMTEACIYACSTEGYACHSDDGSCDSSFFGCQFTSPGDGYPCDLN